MNSFVRDGDQGKNFLSLLGLPHIQKKGLHTSKRTSRPITVYPENSPQKKSIGFLEGASLWAVTSGAQGPRTTLPPPDHPASEINYLGPPSLGARPPKARAHAVSFSRLSRGSPERNLPGGRLVANLNQTESVLTRLAAAHTRVSITRPTAAWGLRPVQARRTPAGLGELRPWRGLLFRKSPKPLASPEHGREGPGLCSGAGGAVITAPHGLGSGGGGGRAVAATATATAAAPPQRARPAPRPRGPDTPPSPARSTIG